LEVSGIWKQLIDVIISGISLGSVYAVMGVGMALVYGVLRVFNFAYGSFYTWGAYIALTLFGLFPMIGYPIVIVIVIISLSIIGFFTERLLIHPLRNKPNWDNTTMMVTLGLAIFLDNLSQIVFGPEGRSLPPLLKGKITLFNFVISTHEIGMLVFAIIIVIGLTLFLQKTRLGLAMQAVSQDTVGARIVGIPINLVFGYTFAISASLVGVSGVLLSPIYFVAPLGGWIILVKAWVITAFGGMGSIKGALYAAFLLGIVEALVGWQFGYMWVMVFWFVVVLIMLIVKPGGLIGKWG